MNDQIFDVVTGKESLKMQLGIDKNVFIGFASLIVLLGLMRMLTAK